MDHFAGDVLDLGDESGCVDVATVAEGAHGVCHLEGGCFGIALTDRDLCVEAGVVAHAAFFAEVFFGGGDSCGFVAEGESCFCAESELCGVVHDERAAEAHAHAVEPSVAGFGEGFHEGEVAAIGAFVVFEGAVSDFECGGAGDAFGGIEFP